eukprot:TRINITY_DN9035_c0_g1_i2.p1 TRINITY_DN9035_c0_g1~~TRINITY_DN9035_c0_g1_i2.p1  ORF type:complete len:268 (+),score=26.53 TRINITY_DN9035_c0_g1_i2:1-804(+)
MSSSLVVTTHQCCSLDDALLHEIHALANSLIQESYEAFCRHSSLHDVVYLFRDKSRNNRLVGCSYWRTLPTALPRVQAIVQGKLRIEADYRRQGLHVRAGLWYYFRKQLRAPLTMFYFISIASLYNFVSMRRAINTYTIINCATTLPATPANISLNPLRYRPYHLLLLFPLIQSMMQHDKFGVDPSNGMVDVKIIIREETVQDFPPSYYSLPESVEYIRYNPRYREGYDLTYVYPFSLGNVISLVWRALQQMYWPKVRTTSSTTKQA